MESKFQILFMWTKILFFVSGFWSNFLFHSLTPRNQKGKLKSPRAVGTMSTSKSCYITRLISLLLLLCRPQQELKFQELGMHVVFPERIDVWSLCVRAMYVTYDHFSYRSKSFKDPELPSMLKLSKYFPTPFQY